ncbi:preprotein translocase subunit YidC [Achromatium sp. WMS2]|nr:preprotein translocase subunit YidC [Achromatium sp. WMS2]
MDFWISNALADSTAFSGQGDLISLLLPIGLVLIVYVFMIQPQVKRQKQHQAMVNALSKGDEVITNGGLVGKISNIGENFAVLEVANNVHIKIRRSAVETVLPKGSIKDL